MAAACAVAMAAENKASDPPLLRRDTALVVRDLMIRLLVVKLRRRRRHCLVFCVFLLRSFLAGLCGGRIGSVMCGGTCRLLPFSSAMATVPVLGVNPRLISCVDGHRGGGVFAWIEWSFKIQQLGRSSILSILTEELRRPLKALSFTGSGTGSRWAVSSVSSVNSLA